MATYTNVSNQIAALKELYKDDSDVMKNVVYKKNPLLAMIPKDESPSGFAGKYIPVPLIFGNPMGRSANFALAQANQTAPSLVSFFVYRVSNYQLVTIQNELLEATKDSAGAFLDEQTLARETAYRNITNDLASDLFRSGSGTRGTIGAITKNGSTTATSITLTNASDVVQFEVGMILVAPTADGNAGSADYVTVTGVNRMTGVITGVSSVTPASSLSGNWIVGSVLAVQGDTPGSNPLQPQGASSYAKITGLAGWFPQTAPSPGSNFWGVDRSVDTRLIGVIYDGSAETISEALIDASALVAREGGEPDMCFMSFASYAALEKELGAKVQFVDVKHEEAEVAFAGITIHAPYGRITCIPDRNCPSKTAYLLTMSTLKLRTLGKAPHVLTYGLEGLEGLRVGNADALEIRIGYYGNLVCNAPVWNAVIKLAQ